MEFYDKIKIDYFYCCNNEENSVYKCFSYKFIYSVLCDYKVYT